MKRLLTSCLGLGRLPLAPGTWGSIPPAIIFACLCLFGASAAITSLIMAALTILGSIICIKFAHAAIEATQKNDPPEVVADEFAGQALAFICVPFLLENPTPAQIWTATAVGFVFFRLFDITKPWPVKNLEKYKNGFGILLDDLMAGIYAGLLLMLCLKAPTLEFLNSNTHSNGLSLNMFSAAILGAIQGLTEFLPVSSSGHLVLFENFFGLNPQKTEMLLFDLAIHLGTLIAIFIVFRKSITEFVKNLSNFKKYDTSPIGIYKKNPAVHLIVLAAVATFVTAIIGLLFEKYFASARGSLLTVTLMWVVTATLLIITDHRKKTKMGLRQFGILAAVIVGLAQAAAIMPGISRSGATICVAILIGLRRRWAVEFSFLIAIPAIIGATAVQFVKNFHLIDSANLTPAAAITGLLVAAVVGILALKLLIKTARNANLKFFALYCYILAAFVAVYLLSNP
ncbi:MAG: phosphatidylglycerophosphatase A [Sedimentisphaerales bacterium]|nr:phosphatidylglycerophosphatase A [Sedimentisphaerales bacterium]